jgi:hypothetical protein
MTSAWIKTSKSKGANAMIVRLIIGVVAGGLLGYGAYRFIGCSTGACPLTAHPWISTIWGMIIGGLLAKAF